MLHPVRAGLVNLPPREAVTMPDYLHRELNLRHRDAFLASDYLSAELAITHPQRPLAGCPQGEIQRYLGEVYLRMRGSWRDEVYRELEEHLSDAVASYRQQGYSAKQATALALADLGDPQTVAEQFQQVYHFPIAPRNMKPQPLELSTGDVCVMALWGYRDTFLSLVLFPLVWLAATWLLTQAATAISSTAAAGF